MNLFRGCQSCRKSVRNVFLEIRPEQLLRVDLHMPCRAPLPPPEPAPAKPYTIVSCWAMAPSACCAASFSVSRGRPEGRKRPGARRLTPLHRCTAAEKKEGGRRGLVDRGMGAERTAARKALCNLPCLPCLPRTSTSLGSIAPRPPPPPPLQGLRLNFSRGKR